MLIDVPLRERVLVHINGRPERYLAPGRHRLFGAFKRVQLFRHDTSKLLAELDASELELVPAEDLRTLKLQSHERALVFRRGRPALWLRPGEHQVWTVERSGPPGAPRDKTHDAVTF